MNTFWLILLCLKVIEKEYLFKLNMDDSLTQYFKNVRKFPMLTREQEQSASPQELVVGNLRLVVSIAKGFQGRGIELSDLIQTGNEGLIHASKKFKKGEGRFSTYAIWQIRVHIDRFVKRQATSIRIPLHVRAELIKLNSLRQTLTPEEVEKIIPKDKQNFLDRAGQPTVSLQTPVLSDDGSRETLLQDFIPDEKAEELFEIVDKPSVLKMLEILPKRKKEILICRYGLLDNKYKTLEEVGKIFKCTKQNINYIEQECLIFLRERIK